MSNRAVWGYADEFRLNFIENESGTWVAQVPLDTKDGTYFVQIQMQNEAGRIGYYDGYLYVFKGKFNLKIKRSPIQFEVLDNCTDFSIISNSISFDVKGSEVCFTMIQRCEKFSNLAT